MAHVDRNPHYRYCLSVPNRYCLEACCAASCAPFVFESGQTPCTNPNSHEIVQRSCAACIEAACCSYECHSSQLANKPSVVRLASPVAAGVINAYEPVWLAICIALFRTRSAVAVQGETHTDRTHLLANSATLCSLACYICSVRTCSMHIQSLSSLTEVLMSQSLRWQQADFGKHFSQYLAFTAKKVNFYEVAFSPPDKSLEAKCYLQTCVDSHGMQGAKTCIRQLCNMLQTNSYMKVALPSI